MRQRQEKANFVRTIKDQSMKPVVSIIMGSDSDLSVMKDAAEVLEHFGIPVEVTVVSAHRTPARMVDFATHAHERGIRNHHCRRRRSSSPAGHGSQHLAITCYRRPCKIQQLHRRLGQHSFNTQMPNGVPVQTVALNAAENAGILAAQILASTDADLQQKVLAYKLGHERDGRKS